MRSRLAVAAIAAGFVVFGLSSRPAPAGPDKADYKVVAVANGGSIRGKCRLSEAVVRWKVPHFKDTDKGCTVDHETDRTVCTADGGLANCFVYLKTIAEGKEWPEAMKSEDRIATIDQKGCSYTPHVQWARAKTQVVVKNSDRADHNIHGYKETMSDTKFNFASPPGSTKDDVEPAFLEVPAEYLVKCDIHPWMSAFIQVVPHPYCDVTAAAEDEAAKKKPGEFLLTDVPPGKYTVVCWHEGLEETPQLQDGKISMFAYSPAVVLEKKEVVVEAGKEKVLEDFVIDAPKKRDADAAK